MKIKYDKEAKAMYIYLTDIPSPFGIVDHTQEVTENLSVDFMADGTPYGIAILDVETEPLIE